MRVVSLKQKEGDNSCCCCPDLVNLAATSLRSGNIIGVPTDTIYGVASLAQSLEAVEKLYIVKNRHREKPIAICVGQINDIYRWCNVTVPRSLLEDLLPGPVTLIFERTELLNSELNPSTSLVGVRIPEYHFIQELAKACKEPLALTSANLSSEKSCLEVKEFSKLWDQLDLVFDGGRLGMSAESRAGSTVVNLSQEGYFSIVRDGCALSKVVDILSGKHGLKQFNS